MIEIKLNRQSLALPPSYSLVDVLAQHVVTPEPYAVAVNKTFVPKQQYSNIILQQGDDIDIVTPMQGG